MTQGCPTTCGMGPAAAFNIASGCVVAVNPLARGVNISCAISLSAVAVVPLVT